MVINDWKEDGYIMVHIQISCKYLAASEKFSKEILINSLECNVKAKIDNNSMHS
jgi:hypothetical protein